MKSLRKKVTHTGKAKPLRRDSSPLARAFAEGTGPVVLYTSQMRAHLAEVLAEVNATGRPVVVRKKGSTEELARIVPPQKAPAGFFGCMAAKTVLVGEPGALFSSNESWETSETDPLVGRG